MNKNLVKLYNQLQSYEEAAELRKIIASHSYPAILRLAQEQLSLFKPEEEAVEEAVEPFSFRSLLGSGGLDEEGANLLDQIFQKMKDRFPERTNNNILSELRSDFFSSLGYSGYYSGPWIQRNDDKLKKYLKLFPDMAWKPTEHQLSLPLKEIPATIPLGGSPEKVSEVIKQKELAEKIKKEIDAKEEYRPLRMPYYEGMRAAGGYAEHSALSKKRDGELEDKFIENNIPTKYINDYLFENRRDFTYRDDLVESAKKELEERWHKLKEKNDILVREIESFNPGSYSVKPAESIQSYEDFVYSITEYAAWVSKKFIIEHLEYRPIFNPRWTSSRPAIGNPDISDLTKLLELSTTDLDPMVDYRTKLKNIQEQEVYCESVLKYVKTWKTIFRKMDKGLLPEVQKKVSSLDKTSIRLFRWVEKFKPEVIKKAYGDYISLVASNVSSEAEAFPQGESTSLRGRSDYGLDFPNLFLHKRTQTDLIGKLSSDLFKSLGSIGHELILSLKNKIEAHLAQIIKNKFEEKYFKLEFDVSEDGLRRNYHSAPVPLDVIRRFIQDWSGRPNLKSFENVILSVTKDPSVVDSFYKLQFSEGYHHGFKTDMFYHLHDSVISFISKLKVGNEEEIYRIAEESLLPAYEEALMKSISGDLMVYLSDIESKLRYGEVNFMADSWKAISPTVNSAKFIGMTDLNQRYYGSATPKRILKRILLTLSQTSMAIKSDIVDFNKKHSPDPRPSYSAGEKLVKIIDEVNSVDSNFVNESEMMILAERVIEDIRQIIVIIESDSISKSLGNERIEVEKQVLNTLSKAINEIKNANKLAKFIKTSKNVSNAFGGIGFKDISSGINNLFTSLDIQGVSKKEFIQITSQLISSSFIDSSVTINDPNDISSFLGSISEGVFKKYISKIIKALNLRDTKQILSLVFYSHKLFKSNNLSEEDLEKAIRLIGFGDAKPEVCAEKWIKAASFIHNNATVPTSYLKRLINSPNFYSDTKVSKEFIEACTNLYLFGGISALKNSESGAGFIVQSLIESGLISDRQEFFRVLNSFSRLCANKAGVRPNIGNGTPSMRLDDYLEENKILDNMRADFPDWDSLSFDDKILKVKEEQKGSFVGFTEEEINSAMEEFEKTIKKLKENSVTEEQYLEDMKIKTLIQSASAKLKLVGSSEAIIRYAKEAKKKDDRLFNLQWESPGYPFRFRVLKNLDPYHFEVGAATNCCQRLNGVGEAAAIDSFINPFAGVLVLEGNISGEWKTLSQSYFHFVPKSNGVILDNVESSWSNINKFKEKVPFNMDQAYAAFAAYIKEKNNLSYVRCGTEYNKLTNSSFGKGNISGGDPRYFEHSRKYSDFSSSSHIDLLKPKFKLTMSLEDKKAMSFYSKLIKLSYKLTGEERLDLLDLCFGL